MADPAQAGGVQSTYAPRHDSKFENPDQGQYSRQFQRPYHQRREYQPYVFKPNFLKNQPQTDAEGNEVQSHFRKFGRKVIDWTSPCVKYINRRRYSQFSRTNIPSYIASGYGGGTHFPPDELYAMQMLPPQAHLHCPGSCVTTRFVRTATNKRKCQIHKLAWTPDGRRIITGASTGEFTLWNGQAFNFETILQAHEQCIRAMTWSNNEQWLVSGDHGGYVKYWQANMNNVHMFQAHKDQAVRSISFSPTDTKFATCSDDATVRIWDFMDTKVEEQTMRGHGSDVKDVQWNPQKSLLASGSKDVQTPVKLWCPKTGQSIATLHCHKGTVMELKWNKNGKWLLTASRDHMVKVFDIRNLKQELQIFRGHKCEASCVAWHPVHESLFASGGANGDMFFWQVGEENELASVEPAHTSIIWSLAWHPIGHTLASGSNDNTARFWVRNRPGDSLDATGCNRDEAEHEQAPDQYGHIYNRFGPPSNVPQAPAQEKLSSFLGQSKIPGLNTKSVTDTQQSPFAAFPGNTRKRPATSGWGQYPGSKISF